MGLPAFLRICRKRRKTCAAGRRRATRGTQEGFLSFFIISFLKLIIGLKNLLSVSENFFGHADRKAGSPLGLPAFLYDIEKGEGKWCVSLQAFCLLYSS